MAQRHLELSCERFRSELNKEDDHLIRTTSLEDVRTAIARTERELASRQGLRNFDRLSSYISAIERYGAVVEVFCNSSPIVPYIWGPVKLIILAIKEQTRALEIILAAYAQIGNALPRLSALQQSTTNNPDFQLLFAFLHGDITDFHRKVYKLIRRPAWPVFFASSWSRFERTFSTVIDNIQKTSDLIDKQAATYHILEVKEWRQKSLDDSATREERWETEQLQAVLNWLGTEVRNQELKRDWLASRSHEGTSSWITTHPKFRSWLQRGRGNQVLWIHGKPGAGKSVLVSKIISFVSADPKCRVVFFFCDYRTPGYEVTTQILKAYLAQCISCDRGIVPFLYDEYLAKGHSPIAKVLKQALMTVLKCMDFVRLVVDGIDEVQASEHKVILRELIQFTKLCGETCKLLIASQDLPSIRPSLAAMPYLLLGQEKKAIDKDIGVVVDLSLKELDETLHGVLLEADKTSLRESILSKAEGMFLWVNLVLVTLETSCSLYELRSNIDALPKSLEEMYEKLLNNIRGRCTPRDMSRVSRIFEWLLFAEGASRIQKFEVIVGSSIYQDCTALDRDHKPFPNALDICKPLIEDGPGGTVALIHSTLPPFLLGRQSGPFISAFTAHENIAFACVSHLIQILEFARSELQKEETVEAVGLGFLALQPYANENWILHVLKYTGLTHAVLSQDIPLVRQLLLLVGRHNELNYTPTSRANEGDKDSVPTRCTDRWQQRLSAFPEVCDLILSVRSFQDTFATQQALQGPDTLAVDHDKTLFSLADSNYRAVVKFLLQATDCTGLSKTELAAFQTQFGGTVFVCPVKSCDRSRLGYSSTAELEDHKTRRHRQRLRCYRGNCIYNDVGFLKESSLRQHVQKVHKKEVPRIPTRLNRKRKIENMQLPEDNLSIPSPSVPVEEAEFGLGDLDLERLPQRYKKAVDDWFVVYNPAAPHVLDVDLVHTLFHESVVCCVKFSMDGRYVATGCNRAARIFDMISESDVCVLDHNDENFDGDLYVRSICFSPDGKYLATGSEDKLIRVWDIESRTTRAVFSGHDKDICSLDFSTDGRIIASGSEDRTVRLWDLQAGTSILTLSVDDGIQCVAVSPDCCLIAAGSLDRSIYVWDTDNGHLLTRFTGHEDSVYGVAFSPDGRSLISGSLDKTIKMWQFGSPGDKEHHRNEDNRGCSKTLEGHKDFVLGVTWTPDARWVISGSKDRGVQFWNTKTGSAQLMLQGHKNSVIQVASSPAGQYFATASGDMRARLWSYAHVESQ